MAPQSLSLQRSIQLSNLWLPGAVISFHPRICCSICCTVARQPVALLAAIALRVIELIKRVDDATAPLGLQVQVNHCSADVAMT